MGLFDDLINKSLADAQAKMDHRSFGGNIKESPYSGMSHAELSMLREKLMSSPEMQKLLAPYEHRAFAREWTKENPLVAAPSLAAAIPLYYVAKQPGLMSALKRLGVVGNEATPASLEQLMQSYRGLGEGLGLLSTPPHTTGTDKGS